MFEYKVEDMKLMDEIKHYCGKRGGFDSKHIYTAERTTSREDKIRFIDSQTDGKMTYLLNLIDKWETDEPHLPKDSYGYTKTVSLRAWLKRNDSIAPGPIVDASYPHGMFRIVSVERYINNAGRKGMYDIHEDLVDEVFHRLLNDLYYKEKKYFKEHDEHEILKSQIKEYSRRFGTTFGLNLCFHGDNSISFTHFGPDIPIWQCRDLIEKYHKLEQFIKDLSYIPIYD